MVTSTKQPDKKVVKMADHNNSAVVPQRTLLGDVNEHITCPLCRGYYIDATTIVECLHSFCRSCIIKHLQVKSYCPVCEMMINSAKPNIKLDKALQDIVYKLVPGLFQKEMERRQSFYASRPGPAASATPEQRGEDTERIIFSPEDVISFSLEYADATDADSISSKSSDSNEPHPGPLGTRRFLQCPAVVNISHLKKFLSMKFDIDSTLFAIDILYKRVPLPDYYTLMDIAYIYNWKRNEPMKFFYQIIDYVAIRNRLFDINRKGSHFRDRKPSPASTEDTNVSSPAPNLNDHGSEASSGTDSPMPEENFLKHVNDTLKKDDKLGHNSNETQDKSNPNRDSCLSPKKNDDEVEKSQFLNSFELTAKSNCVSTKSSPVKPVSEEPASSTEPVSKPQLISPKKDEKVSDTLKRKYPSPPAAPELKKLRIEIEKAKIPVTTNSSLTSVGTVPSIRSGNIEMSSKIKNSEGPKTPPAPQPNVLTSMLPAQVKDVKQDFVPAVKQQMPESPGLKRTFTVPPSNSPKRKLNESMQMLPPQPQKTVSPLKLQLSKLETPPSSSKSPDVQKPPVKKMPDLKPSISASQSSQNKVPPANKVRRDLLANNSDPTIDRSNILSQVKTSLSAKTAGPSTSGDPLKSLFDSCKITIPSSLSITLTDQKLDLLSPGEPMNVDPMKGLLNKNLAGISNSVAHNVPTPPVHNYIEILKLPDSDPKKTTENPSDTKTNPSTKSESSTTSQKPPTKSSETSAKGPVPNLKPIADTKHGKQSANFSSSSSSSPITFQQTFEQQLQSLQGDKKSKLPKSKSQVPKLVPATPKSFSAANKPNVSLPKPNTSNVPATEQKSSTALDLSTPHNVTTHNVTTHNVTPHNVTPHNVTPHNVSQFGQQQTFDKAFETMQSIANLAKKQNIPPKGLPLPMSQGTFASIPNRPLTTGASPLRIPSTSNMGQMKLDKPSVPMTSGRQETPNKMNPVKSASNQSPTVPSPSYQIPSHSPSNPNPSPAQTRSPSSSPKLVIAEEKQTVNLSEQIINQSNQISSTQMSSSTKSESPKPSPGPSKPVMKTMKPLTPAGKITGIRQPITPNFKPNPGMSPAADYLARPQLMAHHAFLRHMEMNAWLKAQKEYEMIKNMTNLAHQSQNDFNNKDKQ